MGLSGLNSSESVCSLTRFATLKYIQCRKDVSTNFLPKKKDVSTNIFLFLCSFVCVFLGVHRI